MRETTIRRWSAALAWAPEWPVTSVVVIGWAVLAAIELSASPHGHHRATFGASLVAWGLMALAMMVPATLPAVRHVGLNSIRSRRHWAMSLYVGTYLAVWMLFGAVVLLIARAASAAGIGDPRFAALALATAAAWQLTRTKRRAIVACRRTVALPPDGWRADFACARFAVAQAWRCLVACWPLMVLMAVTGHGLALMIVLTAIVTIEERARRRDRLIRPLAVAFAAMAILVAFVASASAQVCPALEVRNANGNYVVPGVKGDIPYANGVALDAYIQPGPERRPSVVVIHGGTWSSGSRIAHVGQLLELLTASGYNWFSLDYRLEGLAAYERSLADIRSALAFITCRSRELGIDASRLVLLGEDSGAHLAALVASGASGAAGAAERPPGVIGAILIGGFYDLAGVPAARDLQPDVRTRASPLSRIAPKMPPMLVVHGGADNEAPAETARRYCEGVARVEGRCQFLEVPGASHRSENWWPSQWTYKRQVVDWLASVAAVPPPGPQSSGRGLQKDIVYNPATGLELDAFVPRSATPGPAVIVVHGGGWEAGDKVTYVTPLFEPLAEAGLAWFSIDYRLTPSSTHEQQLEDVRNAIRFVRAQHARFNIDPAKIFLVGESASGQMVAQIATEDRSIAGIISFYGVYDFPAMVTDASPRSLLVRLFRRSILDDESRAILRRYSPLYTAHARMPPVLLVNGTGERLWQQAQAFAKRLSELGVRHEVLALDGAPHGMENWEGHPEWQHYKARVVEWIGRVASGRGPRAAWR